MGDKHDMLDYAFSKAIMADYPKLIRLLETYFQNLYPYAQYKAVWHVLQSVKESQMLMRTQLKYYNKVHKAKGKVQENE